MNRICLHGNLKKTAAEPPLPPKTVITVYADVSDLFLHNFTVAVSSLQWFLTQQSTINPYLT